MEVVKITTHLLPWKVTVKFRALRDHRKVFGHLFGDKVFWISKGELVTVVLPRSWNLDVGDQVKFSSLVCEDQLKFNWNFA